MGKIFSRGWPLWPESFPGLFSRHVLLASTGVSPFSGDRYPSERTGLVRAAGSAGVPLKSLLSGKRPDVVPALPSGCGRKSISSFPWAYPEARTALRDTAVCQGWEDQGEGRRLRRPGPPGRCSRWAPSSASHPRGAEAAFAPAPPGSSRESELSAPRL